QDRPHESHLTEFYLLLAAGGVLGGIFNSLLAPLLFRTVLEFQLVLALICLARPQGAKATGRDMMVAGAGVASPLPFSLLSLAFLSVDAFRSAALVIAILAILAGIAAVAVSQNRILFALVIAALCAEAALIAPLKTPGLLTVRSFFGVSRVVTMTDPKLGPVH